MSTNKITVQKFAASDPSPGTAAAATRNLAVLDPVPLASSGTALDLRYITLPWVEAAKA